MIAPRIRVLGQKPVPFGSFIVRGRFAVPENDGELRRWQKRIKQAAIDAAFFYKLRPIGGPAEMRVLFLLPRPPYHFEHGFLKASAPKWPIEKRRDDVDKFLRATFDAVSGALVDDDARFCRVHMEKRYASTADRAGVVLQVRRIT